MEKEMLGPLLGPLIGILGVVAGAFLNEWIRRGKRVEEFAMKLFEKRLTAYEGLYRKMNEGYELVEPVLEGELSKEERHTRISEAVLDVCRYVDENQLYINQEVAVHCCTAFMGAEDVGDVDDEVEREAAKSKVRLSYKQAKEMIRKETGLEDVDRLLAKVLKIRHESDVIEYMRKRMRGE
jgi:hypothetical protein